jgi:hypothetical protein
LISGQLSIRFDQNSLVPDDVTLLTNIMSANCATFQHNDQARPKITKFRVQIPDTNVNEVKITLCGTDLGCDTNLYVTLLIAAETEKWTGKWSNCPIVATSSYFGQDTCTYKCQCEGDCEEIQVMKRPRNVTESFWTLCPIHLNDLSQGNPCLI